MITHTYFISAILAVVLIISVVVVSGKNQPSQQTAVSGAESVRILPTPWSLSGSKSMAMAYQQITGGILTGKNVLKVSYDLHGLCLLPGVASTLGLVQHSTNTTASVELANYGTNCKDGIQDVDIPLAAYSTIDWNKPIDGISISIWYPTTYQVDVTSIVAYNSGSVLGIMSEGKKKEHKTFPNITPIRTAPYARVDKPN